MSDAAPYVIAVAVGGIGDQCGYVLLAERAGRRRVFGPFFVESPTSIAADVWAATYEGIARACRMPLATSARREVLVVLLGAVQVLERAGVSDGRPLIAAAARALTETGSTLRWARRHESEMMAAAHDALAEAGTAVLALRQGVGRLIRSTEDWGCVVVCDPRLSTKGYGADIVRSLGMPTRTRSIAEACAWLARGVEGMQRRQTAQAAGGGR